MDVVIRETTVELPTHRLQSPSVNPALFGRHFHPFPYTMQNQLSEKLEPVLWRAIELENEYLKLTVLPDMGGRVAALYDKLAGRDIFTPITQVKPRMIAHRGAWPAGGLEFNFPISHSPTTMDSVNCMTRRYQDGSASVIFGAVERLSFMNWKVELRLYPEKAYLEESVELLNPTDNFHRFYFWSNAAVPYVRGMRMGYPFDWRTAMNRGYEKWPMDGSVDSSDPAMIPDSYETFGKLMQRDYFSVHYPGWDWGVAHAANRKRVKGAKFFHWGNSGLAAAWNRALLDGGKEYIEIQSGPFESQSVYKHLPPHGRMQWKEYWYGVRGIGMIGQAARDAAVAVERTCGGAVVKLSANSRLGETTVCLTHGGAVQQAVVSLTPESPSAVEFTGIPAGEPLAVDVICGGRLVASFGRGCEPAEDEPDTDLFEDSRVHHPAGEYDDRPLARGMQHEQWGRVHEAAEAYEENLMSRPHCTATLARLGRIRLAQRKPGLASDCFVRALRYDNRNGAARFGLAAAKNRLGDAFAARRLFMDIAADDPLFEASLLEAAALNLRQGDPWGNIALLEGFHGPWAQFLLSVSRRAAGLAAETADGPMAAAEFQLAEQFLASGDSTALSVFTGGREDQLVCVALQYVELDRAEDCLAVLGLVTEPGMKTALASALCGTVPVAGALAMPIDGVFINEPALLHLLESVQDDTGAALWLLGCHQYAVGLHSEAVERWLAAYGCGLRHTALLFSLGQALHLQGESDRALQFLREDVALHGCANAECLALLCNLAKERGDTAERLELLPLLLQTGNRPMVLTEIVEALQDGGRLEEALAMLETAELQNWENGETAGPLWSGVVGRLAMKLARGGQAEAARAMAGRMFDYPEGLYYGRSPARSQAEHLLTLGQVYRLIGDDEKAYEAFKQGAAEGGVPAIRANEAAMRWVRLCQDALRA